MPDLRKKKAPPAKHFFHYWLSAVSYETALQASKRVGSLLSDLAFYLTMLKNVPANQPFPDYQKTRELFIGELAQHKSNQEQFWAACVRWDKFISRLLGSLNFYLQGKATEYETKSWDDISKDLIRNLITAKKIPE